MNTLQKRFFFFLVGCIGTRLSFALLAKTISLAYLPFLGYLALVPAVGFLFIYIFGLRKTGEEVFGDSIWWNDLRPVHAGMYGLFAYLAITNHTSAWIVLLLDVVLGLGAFLRHHFLQGHFATVGLL